MKRYTVREFTAKAEFAILVKDSSLLDEIEKNIAQEVESVLDFSGIKLLLAPFMNEVVGPLFKKYDRGTIDRLVSYENVRSDDAAFIKYCCDSYEEYYIRKRIAG